MVKKKNEEETPAVEQPKAVADILKRFGEGSVMRLGDRPAVGVDAIPTGSVGLDMAIGIGGIPRGRIIEIYGPESSGKSTLCQHIVAEAQKKGDKCWYIDMEHALDPQYAAALGVDLSSLYISQPQSGEQALEIAETAVRSGEFGVVVVDSVAALVPQKELEGDMGDATMGVQARLMSQACRKLNGAIGMTNTTVIFVNQLRQKIGVVFGNPETTTGGNALKYYASVRLDVRRAGTIKTDSEKVGTTTKVTVVKNKVAPPFKVATFDIMYGKGINLAAEVLDLAEEFGIVQKRGSFYSYGEVRLGQGRAQAVQKLTDDPELCTTIYSEVKGNFNYAALSYGKVEENASQEE